MTAHQRAGSGRQYLEQGEEIDGDRLVMVRVKLMPYRAWLLTLVLVAAATSPVAVFQRGGTAAPEKGGAAGELPPSWARIPAEPIRQLNVGLKQNC